MDLKELLGDDYKEDMTLEEINEALEGKELVDPSTLPKSVEKKVFDKTATELAKAKKELKALREKSMTDEEKVQAELDRAAEIQLDFQKELSKLRAKEIFVTAGLTSEDYDLVLDTVVTEDEESTKNRAKAMVKLINNQKETTEKAIRAELLKDTPRPPAGTGADIGDKSFEKEIEAAQERGDMIAVASLTRQQAEASQKKGD